MDTQNISSSSSPKNPPPPPPQQIISRRVPPPCWGPDETTALIQSYRDKWYSLRRGNLRSHHWQEVADQVASRFPSSPKTSVQCRHKMEKLRKRHRAEKQRAAAFPSRFKSNWPHFHHMEDMERGPQDPNHHTNNNINAANANGYLFRAPERSPKFYANFDEFGVPKPSARSTQGMRNEHGVRGEIGRKFGVEERNKGSPTGEMVEAIRALGDRFVRAEKMKMDMAREIEEMRMEMEMKRTAMILDSQQQLVEAFADAVFGSVSKKNNKIQTPDC